MHGTYANITNKIFILQKNLLNLPFNTHTTEYFKNARILKPTDLYESQISKHMFKCLDLNANILPRHSDIHNYSTRNNDKFIAPKYNMRKSKMSINFKSIKVWTKLPSDIPTSNSLNVFMDNLRNYFLSRYWVHHWWIFNFFLRYAVCLCNVLPTIGQYSIDIAIKYSFNC